MEEYHREAEIRDQKPSEKAALNDRVIYEADYVRDPRGADWRNKSKE